MAKIIGVSNYANETVSDIEILWPMTKGAAEAIAYILNKEAGDEAHRFYRVVPNDYKLCKFEP